jgi:hypothetical protein
VETELPTEVPTPVMQSELMTVQPAESEMRASHEIQGESEEIREPRGRIPIFSNNISKSRLNNNPSDENIIEIRSKGRNKQVTV